MTSTVPFAVRERSNACCQDNLGHPKVRWQSRYKMVQACIPSVPVKAVEAIVRPRCVHVLTACSSHCCQECPCITLVTAITLMRLALGHTFYKTLALTRSTHLRLCF